MVSLGARSANTRLCGDWMGSGDNRRSAAIDVVKLLTVFGGCTLVLDLGGHGRRARAAEGGNFSRLRTGRNATATSVVGYASVVDDDGSVIDVGDIDVDAIDGTVVVESVSVPVAAVITEARVAEAVVDTTIEANMCAPISAVEAPTVVVPAPIARGPEGSIVGREAPGAWNPVIASGCPVPIARGPDVVGSGSFGLVIFGEWWRRLIGVLDGLGLAFFVELIERLGVLVGLTLVRGWGSNLGNGLWRILLGCLYRLSLSAGSKNPALSRYGSGSCSRLGLCIVDRGHVGVGRIRARVVGDGYCVWIDSVTAGDTDKDEDAERRT